MVRAVLLGLLLVCAVPLTARAQQNQPYPPLVSVGFVPVAPFTTSTGFTAPAGATVCFVQVQGQPVNWRADNTTPTAAIGPGSTPGGVPLPVGANLTLHVTDFSKFHAIPQAGTSTMTADCYHL